VVDDDADTCELVGRYLHDYGARVNTAISARKGLALLGSFKPDVLISDIGMPEQDGYEFIREIRGRSPEDGGTVPAVAMTAFARPEDRTQAMMSGFQLHLAKPVEPADLIAVVANLMGRSENTQADAKGLVAEVQTVCTELAGKPVEVESNATEEPCNLTEADLSRRSPSCLSRTTRS